mmetsp:Transcript_16078/g.39375  ORF Transcript_16078/g.39375 Transcript_16078/m.39375 type:complete len:392 (-) Transcript_16078:83-1258(-)
MAEQIPNGNTHDPGKCDSSCDSEESRKMQNGDMMPCCSSSRVIEASSEASTSSKTASESLSSSRSGDIDESSSSSGSEFENLPSLPLTTRTNTDEERMDDWEEILNWMRSAKRDPGLGVIEPFEKQTLEKLIVSLPTRKRVRDEMEGTAIVWVRIPRKADVGASTRKTGLRVIEPFEKETLEKLLVSLPTRKRIVRDEMEDTVIDWVRIPRKVDLGSSTVKALSKEETGNKRRQIPNCLPIETFRLSSQGGGMAWIRNISQIFVDSFSSTVLEQLLFWTDSMEEESENLIHGKAAGQDCNPPEEESIKQRSSSDHAAPQQIFMIRGEESFVSQGTTGKGSFHNDDCPEACKSQKSADESSVVSLETLETHFSKLSSDDHSSFDMSWKIEEV